MLFYHKKQVVQKRNAKLAIASNMNIDILPSKFQQKTEKRGSKAVVPLKVGMQNL